MRIVKVKLSLHLFFDKVWNRKVGLSQIAFDHPLSLLLDGPDLRSDLKGVLRIDEAGSLRK
jgi:hypothetical protein